MTRGLAPTTVPSTRAVTGPRARTDLFRAEWLAPDVERLAECVVALDRRLDVDDPAGVVGVQRVEACAAHDERRSGVRLAEGWPPCGTSPMASSPASATVPRAITRRLRSPPRCPARSR